MFFPVWDRVIEFFDVVPPELNRFSYTPETESVDFASIFMLSVYHSPNVGEDFTSQTAFGFIDLHMGLPLFRSIADSGIDPVTDIIASFF